MMRPILFWSVLLSLFILGLNGYAAKEVARVNGTVITDKDVQESLSGFNDGQQTSILGDKNSRFQVVSNLVDQELLYQHATKKGLDRSGEFNRAMAAFKKQYLASLVVERELAPKLTQQRAKQYYEANKPMYSTTKIRAQHVLVSSEDQAKEIMKRVRAKDADFQAIAEKFSIDPSAKNNRGDLGYFTMDRMVPEFSHIAFTGKVGDIKGPVRTAYGWHVIKVVDRQPGKSLEYEEVELKVKSALKQTLLQDYMTGLRKGAEIQISKN